MQEEAKSRHALALRLQGSPTEQDILTLSATEKAAAYREWANSHRRGLPLLSNEAISRESIYSDERL